MNKKHIGSTLDSMFEELGELEDVKALAQKKLFAYELEQAMKKKGVTRTQLANRMGSPRPVVYRMLDGKSGIDTMARAAKALGYGVEIRLVSVSQALRRIHGGHGVPIIGNATKAASTKKAATPVERRRASGG